VARGIGAVLVDGNSNDPLKRQLLNDPEFAFLGRTAEE